MTIRPFTVEPWCLRETALDLDVLPQAESLFALSNGHVGLRGNLDEGEPHGLPGTYLNSVYELRPLPYAEAGFGFPESGQTVINVTDGKLIRLLVDDEPFDVRYGELHQHERVLDFRAGTLHRTAEWTSPAGKGVKISTTRVVSLTQRAIAAISYEVESLDGPVRVVLQSELVANEQLPPQSADPRAAAVLDAPLRSEEHSARDTVVAMVHVTKRSELRVAVAMDHVIEGPDSVRVSSESYPDAGRVTVSALLKPGQKLRLIKYVAYGWSSQRSLPAVRDQVAAALTLARHTGWDDLIDEQRSYLDDFWSRADVEVDGDAELQQSIRFALFHVLMATARAEQRAIPAKGLTGPGYDGHTFWDTETFVLQALTYTIPDAAADALRWRHTTLGMAQERARQLNLPGAAFPWRTIRGQECSGYWPAGTAAFHIGADIADAVVRYVSATEDVAFERSIGLELLVETARLWRGLGHHDLGGRFRIDGVTGPDEYSAIADNNVYTNLMAQKNLRNAAAAAGRHLGRANELGVNAEEMASWRDAAAAMYIPYDERLGVHPQAESFTSHQAWDFAATKPEQYPLLLNFPYFELYRKQVVKQADLVLAIQLCGDAFTEEQKARDFHYYEALTVRDSSLSACTQSAVAAEVGHMDLAYDYLDEAARLDLDDLAHNTKEGVHLANMAGTWVALTAGFGGMRDRNGSLDFAPRLPEGLTRLAFNVALRGRRLRVEVTSASASYTLLEGKALQICHHGEKLTVQENRVATRKIPAAPVWERPTQPVGREPARRRNRESAR